MRNMAVLLSALTLAFAGCGKRLPTEVPQQANSVPRRVVMELFTATWCSNCPDADTALEKLAGELGDSLTIIEYHPLVGTPSDPLATSQTQERGQFYGVEAWPTLWCDGVTSQTGTAQDPYQTYATLARNRLLLNSPVSLNVTGTVQGASLQYNISIDPRASISKADLRLLVMVLEDSVFYNAPNMVSIHRYVCRRIEPGTQGLPLSLIPGITQLKQGAVSLDTVNWRKDRLWLAVFIQSFFDQEIIQSCFLDLSRPVWDFSLSSADTLHAAPVDLGSLFDLKLKNTGNQPDTFWVDMPDSLSQPPGITRIVKDAGGAALPLPAGFFVGPGDSVKFTVTLTGQAIDDFRVGLMAWPGRQPTLVKTLNLHLNVTATVVFDYLITAPDTSKISLIGEVAEFPVIIKNIGNQGDSIYLDLPDSLAVPPGLARSLCNISGVCYPIPLARYLAAGDSITNLAVHMQSSVSGSCETSLTLRSKSSPGLARKRRLMLEVVK